MGLDTSTCRRIQETSMESPALPALATIAYSRVRKKSNNRSDEYIQRRSVDDIIDLAFSTKLDRHCRFR